MKQTENFKLNLMETSDPFSAKPLNDNFNALDALLKKRDEEINSKRLFVDAGTYTGDGATTRTMHISAHITIDNVIHIHSFTPVAVLVKKRIEPTTSGSYLQEETFRAGWGLWTGELEREAVCIKGGHKYSCKIKFTVANGSLTCTLVGAEGYDEDIDHGVVINNENGATYDYIAFGY